MDSDPLQRVCSSDPSERVGGCSRNIKARDGRYGELFKIPARRLYRLGQATATMSIVVPLDVWNPDVVSTNTDTLYVHFRVFRYRSVSWCLRDSEYGPGVRW